MNDLRHVYAEKALAQIPRLLTLQDRNPFSPSYGCFDRTFWHDKAVDFPTAMAQFGVQALALVYSHMFPKNIYFHNKKIKRWILAGMYFWTQIQNGDGSFDEFYPNEHGWAAPTGFLLYATMDAYRRLRERIAPKISDTILDTATKAARFLIKHDEPSIVANHHAMVALALYTTYNVLKEKYLLDGFYKKLDYFFELHTPEGWSWEYDGADLGYLSATISFLSKVYAQYKSEKLLDVLEIAIQFTSYFVYPDGFLQVPLELVKLYISIRMATSFLVSKFL